LARHSVFESRGIGGMSVEPRTKCRLSRWRWRPGCSNAESRRRVCRNAAGLTRLIGAREGRARGWDDQSGGLMSNCTVRLDISMVEGSLTGIVKADSEARRDSVLAMSVMSSRWAARSRGIVISRGPVECGGRARAGRQWACRGRRVSDARAARVENSREMARRRSLRRRVLSRGLLQPVLIEDGGWRRTKIRWELSQPWADAGGTLRHRVNKSPGPNEASGEGLLLTSESAARWSG